MNAPSKKGQRALFERLANSIAELDLDQEDREAVARSVGNALDGEPYYDATARSLFVLLASDPLVPCAGVDGEPCPHGRVIRIAMHLSTAPDGRSAAWRRRAPYGGIRCVSCGAREFVGVAG